MEARPEGTPLARAGLVTVAATAAALLVNLLTGILIARALGPTGRGVVAAVFATPPLLAWLFAMGCSATVTYHQARRPSDASRLVATWLVLCLPLMLIATSVGEVVLPHLLAAQSAQTLFLARLVMLMVTLMFIGDLMNGILLGDQDFGFYNVVRVGQPVAVAVGYSALWLLDGLTASSAVAVLASATAASVAALTARVVRRHGIGRPSREIARRTLWYGVRAHSTSTAGLVNTRLDVLIIPAFLGAASVGLYSIATNVSWIVVTVSGSIGAIVFPAAVARGREGRYTVVKSLYATLAIATLLAGAFAAFADIGVRLIYGDEFSGSVGPLRILLLGSVLYAAASTLFSGLYAVNRPFTAAVAQLSAAAVTVAGLLLFLERGGIQVAAIVETIAYGMVFVIALALYRRAVGLRWRELLLTPTVARMWMRQATRAAAGRV